MRPLTVFLCLLLPACGNLINLGEKAKAKRREAQLKKLTEASVKEASSRLGEKAAGEVVYVDAEGGYALVRARNGLVLEKGQELETRGASPGKLRVTPERKNMFVAADILSGSPKSGDPVVPVKGSGKTAPKLVPVNAAPLAGSSAPANTIYVDPATIRPESIRRSTLDEPGGSQAGDLRGPDQRGEAGNRPQEPELPDKPVEGLLPPPKLPD